MPSPHVHHIHHYVGGSGNHEPVYYDYRNSSLASTAAPKEPIIYDYKPSMPVKNDSSSSSEEDGPGIAINSNEVFVVGVENVLFYGNMLANQHQVVFVAQDSDGISLENELLMKFGQFDESQNQPLQYFRDVEFRFDAEDEPNDADLDNIYRMYKELVDEGRCWTNHAHLHILWAHSKVIGRHPLD